MRLWAQRKHQVLLLITVLTFVLSMLLGLTKLIYETHEDNRPFKEQLYWSAAQLDREYWRFLDALSLYSLGGDGASADDLFLRFDILLSRIDVFGDGEIGHRLTAVDGTAETLVKIAAAVQAIEPDLELLQPGDRDGAVAIRDRVTPHAAALFRLAQRTNLKEQANTSDFRKKTAGTYWILTFLLFGVFATGAVLIAFLIKEVRRANRLLITANTAERRALESELRIRKIMATVSDGIVTTSIDGVVETVNPAMERLFGMEASRIVGRNVSLLMSQDHRDAHDGYLERYKETGRANIVGKMRQLEARRGDGSTFPIELSLGDLNSGTDRLIVGVVRDITERNKAEAALREAHDTLEQRVRERTAELEAKGADLTRLARDLTGARDQAETANHAKSEFLANMSHELRTPLNAIIGFSDIIKDEVMGPLGNDKYSGYAADINDSGRHLLDLINDILDLAKIESGTEQLHEEDIWLPDMIDSIRTLVVGRAQRGGVVLDLHPDEKIPALHADPRKLKQILVNLLSNAIKFTPEGGKVTLRVRCCKDSGHEFQISDGGIGIAPEDIPLALSQFGQVQSDFGRKYEGTGLGLPLSKSLVERHGGTLDLQSELGVGTTVTVRFPPVRIAVPTHERAFPDLNDSVEIGGSGWSQAR